MKLKNMMKRSLVRRPERRLFLVSLVLFLAFCGKASVTPDDPPKVDPPDTSEETRYSALTNKIVNSKSLISSVMKDDTFEVVEGVQETDIRYSNLEGKAMEVFILEIDLNNPNIALETATPNDAPEYAHQTVLNMAKVVDKAGHRIVAGFNGDFWDPTRSTLMGIFHKNGVVIKDTFTENSKLPQQGLSFFGILNNGKPIIADKSEYNSYRSELKNATGSGIVFLKNKKAVPHQPFNNFDPRTAVGYTEEGLVYFVVADGRNPAYSNGMTYTDLANLMKAIGVKDAVNLDGGGSSTFMIRSPTSKSFEVRNQPSDGSQRAVANSWLVVSKNNE